MTRRGWLTGAMAVLLAPLGIGAGRALRTRLQNGWVLGDRDLS